MRQSGSISEQEFWAGRQHLLRKQQGESGAQKQRAGVGNAMLLAMRPSADGKTNTVRGMHGPVIMLLLESTSAVDLSPQEPCNRCILL